MKKHQLIAKIEQYNLPLFHVNCDDNAWTGPHKTINGALTEAMTWFKKVSEVECSTEELAKRFFELAKNLQEEMVICTTKAGIVAIEAIDDMKSFGMVEYDATEIGLSILSNMKSAFDARDAAFDMIILYRINKEGVLEKLEDKDIALDSKESQ